jgi:hypothetical protein
MIRVSGVPVLLRHREVGWRRLEAMAFVEATRVGVERVYQKNPNADGL